MRRLLLLAAVLLCGAASFAQFNTAGRVHLGIGVDLGGHATEIDERFTVLGVTVARTKTSSAATTTLPIEVGVGLGKVASLGLLIEPGRYVPDSNATNQTNNVAVVALQPRFYLLNRDRLAISGSVQIGAAALRVLDDTPNQEWDGRYSGPALGLGAGGHFGLGGHVALELHLRYLATRMELRQGELNGNSVTDFYKATLTTGGVLAQLGLSFRFGG